jgi:hypothetical protein
MTVAADPKNEAPTKEEATADDRDGSDDDDDDLPF